MPFGSRAMCSLDQSSSGRFQGRSSSAGSTVASVMFTDPAMGASRGGSRAKALCRSPASGLRQSEDGSWGSVDDRAAEALARLRVEGVDVARLRRDVDRVARVRVDPAVDTADDVGALALDLRVAVQVAVGAELLDEVDRDLQAAALGGRHDDVLRTHADGDRRAGGREDVALDRDDRVAELDAAVGDV